MQISTPALLRAGINPIEVLLWSRNKTLVEVEEALQAVRNQRQFDFTKDKGFVLKNKDQNTNEESVPKEAHVHFEDDVKLTCPRRNCTFSFNLPKATGDWRNIDILEFLGPPHFRWRQSDDSRADTKSHGSEAQRETVPSLSGDSPDLGRELSEISLGVATCEKSSKNV